MYKLVFVLAVLLLSNSACSVNEYCLEEGEGDCILDEECCTGYCDWTLSPYPATGGCAPRPSGPLPYKPCIPVGNGQTCVLNVTCCQGYCERRYSVEGFCYIGYLPGPEPPAPTPVATKLAPISTPVATDLSPISSPIATPGTPAASPVPTDLAPILSPSSVIIPPYDVPVPAPTPAHSKKDGTTKKPVAPTKAPSKKDKIKHKPVAPTPAPSNKGGRKIKQKKKDKSGSVTCTKAPAPPPAY